MIVGASATEQLAEDDPEREDCSGSADQVPRLSRDWRTLTISGQTELVAHENFRTHVAVRAAVAVSKQGQRESSAGEPELTSYASSPHRSWRPNERSQSHTS